MSPLKRGPVRLSLLPNLKATPVGPPYKWGVRWWSIWLWGFGGSGWQWRGGVKLSVGELAGETSTPPRGSLANPIAEEAISTFSNFPSTTSQFSQMHSFPSTTSLPTQAIPSLFLLDCRNWSLPLTYTMECWHSFVTCFWLGPRNCLARGGVVVGEDEEEVVRDNSESLSEAQNNGKREVEVWSSTLQNTINEMVYGEPPISLVHHSRCLNHISHYFLKYLYKYLHSEIRLDICVKSFYTINT